MKENTILFTSDDTITAAAAAKEETDGCHRDDRRRQHSVSAALVVNGRPILFENDDLVITILGIEAPTLTIITTMLSLP